jgi:hypothetical protein
MTTSEEKSVKVIDQAAWDACERIYPQKVMNLAEGLANSMEADMARDITFCSPVIFNAIETLVQKHGPIDKHTQGTIIQVLTKTWVTPERAEVWEDNMPYMKKYWKGKA